MEVLLALFGLGFPVFIFVGLFLLSGIKIINQYERGVVLTLGKFSGVREPGLRYVVPVFQRIIRVDVRSTPIDVPKQEIITKDNVSVDISAVAYFRVIDAKLSVLSIENTKAAIDQIAQTTLRKVVGQHTLDETLAETNRINMDIREILDMTTIRQDPLVLGREAASRVLALLRGETPDSPHLVIPTVPVLRDTTAVPERR